MAKNETNRIKPSVLADDLETYAAMHNLSNYAPANAAYDKPTNTTRYNDMIAKQQREAQLAGDLAGARDERVASEWAFHNGMLGTKDQVAAQYGVNSNEYQSIGRKKKTEYKSPTRKGGSGTSTPKS
ncbi:MAG TPA: hypothetical protein VNG71_17140 [Pyrinomonadaceae bacterium]|nr:hypothetical protein [Pyrinomonadaceae bacterium]